VRQVHVYLQGPFRGAEGSEVFGQWCLLQCTSLSYDFVYDFGLGLGKE